MTLRTISHSLMVNVRILDAYIHFTLMYTEDNIYLVLPIKDLIIEDGDITTPFKLAAGMKHSVYHLRDLFFTCVVWKYTAHVGTKALNMRHQAQKGFRGIFVGIPQHQKGYLVYVPHRQNIISSYDVVFYDIFSSVLAYKSQQYAEYMAMRPAVSCIPYATSSREKTGNIITFTHFEQGNLLSETCDNMKSGNKYDKDSNMPPLISEEEMDEMSLGNESDDETMSTGMLEDTRRRSFSIRLIS